VAIRRPLVDIQGQQQELPAGDSLPGADIAISYPVSYEPFGGASELTLDDIPGFELADSVDDKGVTFSLPLSPGFNLSTNPKVDFDIFVFATGAGNANAYFELAVKYIAAGELTSKANDETLNATLAIVDVDSERQSLLSFTLNTSLIVNSDSLVAVMRRLGNDVLDTYTGKLMVASGGAVEFGG